MNICSPLGNSFDNQVVLLGQLGRDPFAVPSSVAVEDSSTASFAVEIETVLNAEPNEEIQDRASRRMRWILGILSGKFYWQ
jgi:hypothetical protein